ncbi:hypothetical protein LTR56_003154 [Elasticomyces elasticus]|nr:hypothetical protein LTR22_010687 [Elasticomyces elasticus]KAK3656023.1 hypothetical protein LTR56_003154 [Elasticomyces elasticus]KAK4920914.1 hypothetical protein LTR49_011637 [Elasticomyces elasticus]KAK5759569.1 hypothetical protein LTS12_010261 [Elasticomyces elasticus]
MQVSCKLALDGFKAVWENLEIEAEGFSFETFRKALSSRVDDRAFAALSLPVRSVRMAWARQVEVPVFPLPGRTKYGAAFGEGGDMGSGAAGMG